MRLKLFLSLFLLLPILLTAQDRYVVFSTDGKVQIQKNGWQVLHEKDTVSLNDMIKVSQNSSISIMSLSTREVYTGHISGETTFYEIIQKTSDSNLRIIRNVIKESLYNSNNQSISVSSYGASSRGCEVKDNTRAVYDVLCGAIDAFYIEGKRKYLYDDVVLSRRPQDGIFSFVVKNQSEAIYYINLICLDCNTCSFRLCYPYTQTLSISPMSRLNLPGEFANDDQVIYFLIASAMDFDSSLLDYYLQKRLLPSGDGDFDQIVICGEL